MRDSASPPDRYDEPTVYEIRIKGHLDDRWTEWFDGMSFTRDGDGTTILYGPVVDQCALHGLLGKVRNLALPLVSVIRVDRAQPVVPHIDADADGNSSNKEKYT
jgi:hypothetical protein